MTMIKLNLIKTIVSLLSVLCIGSVTIYSIPYNGLDLIDTETVKCADSLSKKLTVPNFKLYDADEKLFQLFDYKRQVIVLTFVENIEKKRVGRHLMKENRRWLEALTIQYPTEIVICGIKEMTDIPKMIPKAFIRSTLRKEPFRFLIDWEGEVFNDYSSNQLFTIMVIDTNGQIYYESSDEFSDLNFSKLCGKINKLIN